MSRTETEAYAVLNHGSALVLTCEHATNRLPEPWDWHEDDSWIVDTHWAHDPGASEIASALALRLQGTAVLSRFSRLLVDANRGLDSQMLFRDQAEGRGLALNRGLSDEERDLRIRQYYTPYHEAIRDTILARPTAPIFAVHTFSPHYEGETRAMEMGVLFNEHDDHAVAFASDLRECGFAVALNEPYSGKHGFAHSPEVHAARHGRVCLEIEVRQDLACDADQRERIVEALSRALDEVLLP